MIDRNRAKKKAKKKRKPSKITDARYAFMSEDGRIWCDAAHDLQIFANETEAESYSEDAAQSLGLEDGDNLLMVRLEAVVRFQARSSIELERL